MRPDPLADESPEDLDPGEAPFDLVNEFAHVRVRKVYTRNGERLEISSPRLDRRVRLCPLELESLSWQQPEFFSELLSTPYGPEG